MGHFGPFWAVLTHFQLPEGIRLDLDQLYADLTLLEKGYRVVTRDNPAYVPPPAPVAGEDTSNPPVPPPAPEGSTTAPRPRPVPRQLKEKVYLTELEKKEMMYRIRDACTPVAKELDK